MGLPRLALVCHLAELPDNSARGFDPQGTGGDTLFVVRKADLLRAYRDACPHWAGSPMAWRKDAYLDRDANHIVCHSHGARFDIASGLCVQGPCVGDSLQALPLTLDEAGGIHVAMDGAGLAGTAVVTRT